MFDMRRASVGDLSSAEVLRAVQANQRAVWALEAENFALAAHWADLHPAASIDQAASFTNAEMGGSYAEREEPIAGPGCPTVAEFCIAEFGAVLGLTTAAAKQKIGQALELRHRLPRTWALMQAGRVAPWRVARIAETTIHSSPELTPAAMRYLDDEVVKLAGAVGQRRLERLIDHAVLRFDLVTLPDLDYEGSPIEANPESHFVRFEEERVNSDGTMLMVAHLDLADALDLKHAIEQTAAAMAAAGSCEVVGYRHAKALGHLARLATAHAVRGAAGGTAGRALTLNVHLTALHDFDGVAIDPVALLDEGTRTIVLDQIRRWCSDSLTRVTIRPVIDLNDTLSSPGYRPSGQLLTQIQLRDTTCTFPYCGRAAARCDIDHVEAFDPRRVASEQTTSSNTACLCRRHHRLKTFSRWRVSSPSPGRFWWTSPHGHRFVRHPDGTTQTLESPPRGAATAGEADLSDLSDPPDVADRASGLRGVPGFGADGVNAAEVGAAGLGCAPVLSGAAGPT